MRIGIPKEIKTLEGRVALIPAAAGQLVSQGHEVSVQQGAGLLSGYRDDDFQAVGVAVLPDAKTLYAQATLIVKVKEPQPQEVALLRPEQIIFSYLHLAAEIPLLKSLLASGATAVAFETVETDNGDLPLLAPMSDIAGRVAIQVGTHLLHGPMGGKGLLLGGLPAADRGKVVILGGGVAGGNSATVAANLGANVVVFDRNREKMQRMRALGANVTSLYPYPDKIAQEIASADLVVGAVLVTGERAPHIVTEDMVRSMSAGSVIVDISVDQGGCIATTRPTSYADPTYSWQDVIHFCVTNMPGAVPRTASQALSASLLPYILKIVQDDWQGFEPLAKGINVKAGKICHPALQNINI
ncbi:MAG: alanine dehydrogenase [Thiohalomonadales bacterium]